MNNDTNIFVIDSITKAIDSYGDEKLKVRGLMDKRECEYYADEAEYESAEAYEGEEYYEGETTYEEEVVYEDELAGGEAAFVEGEEYYDQFPVVFDVLN